MNKIIFCLLFFISNSVFSGELSGPHDHGEVELLALWQDNIIKITLVASAHDLLGFEREPATAKEKKALRDFDEKYNPFELLRINSEAECEYKKGFSESELFSATPHKHGMLDETHTHELGLKGHIDFLMYSEYECKSAPTIIFELFNLSPSVEKINVRENTIDGEIRTTLSKENNELKF
ncbi:MAG: DUF2796 domain-containing protein [Gammaproteobacteria bacterium]